jgi:TonB family protein
MTRIFSILLFIGLAWGKTTIAVFEFENNGLELFEVRQLSTRLESELVKLGKYNVVERTKIDEILKEQKLQMSGCVEECLIDVGKMLGAKQVIIGSVGRLDNIYTITAKLVDATSGQMLKTSDFDTNDGIGKLATIGLQQIAFELTGENETEEYQTLKRKINNDLSFFFEPGIDIEKQVRDAIIEKKAQEKRETADKATAEATTAAIKRSLEKYEDIEEGKGWWSIDNKYPEVKFIDYHNGPSALTPINPEYPIIAEQKGIIGTVVLQALIDKFGYVNAITVIRGIPNSGLNEAAMDAVRKTRFKPATRRGKAVDVWDTIKVRF